IESVLSQSFQAFELVIADNCSDDGSGEICREYASRDRRIRYVRNEANIGAARNFSRLVDFANGQYFKWLCADDFLTDRFLESCVTELERSNYVSVSPRIFIIDDSGRCLRTVGASDQPGCDAPIMSEKAVYRHRTMMRWLQDKESGRLQIRYLLGLHRRAALCR